jgi:hypothetical protein
VTQLNVGVVPLPIRRAPGWIDPVLGVLAAVLAVAVLDHPGGRGPLEQCRQ